MRDDRKRIRFTVERSERGWTLPELRARDEGGADALILHAVNYDADNEDGQVTVYTMDGATGRMLDDKHLLRAWALIGEGLSRSPGLTLDERAVAKDAFARIRGMVDDGSLDLQPGPRPPRDPEA